MNRKFLLLSWSDAGFSGVPDELFSSLRIPNVILHPSPSAPVNFNCPEPNVDADDGQSSSAAPAAAAEKRISLSVLSDSFTVDNRLCVLLPGFVGPGPGFSLVIPGSTQSNLQHHLACSGH